MDPTPVTELATELYGARLLIVDDVPANLAVLSAALESTGCEILAASDGVRALELAAKARPDLILLDVVMPPPDGLETCRRLKQSELTRGIPVIFITAQAERAGVVDGFRAGGVDYVAKPFQAEEVISRVAAHVQLSRLTRALREKNEALQARAEELQAEIERRREAEHAFQRADETLTTISHLEATRWHPAGLVGNSAPMRRIIEEITRLQPFAQTSVLITGESGTGKEVVARAVHLGSPRAKYPFVPVNCVAIPAELAESLLFGHVKGAFTGATADRKGLFEQADRGTLFLDEIGDMPAGVQVKLLRVLEDGQITPVGAMHPRPVDVRIIAATNADLDARIASGAFRSDLYFRLARYVVKTPPLRERPEDISLLAAHFLERFAAEMSLRSPALSAEAIAALQAHPFPGNIRELRNLIERALILSAGQTIQSSHFQLAAHPGFGAGASTAGGNVSTSVAPIEATNLATATAASLPLNLAAAEEILIQRALQETRGNIADAARLLGVHRTRVYRRLAQQDPDAPG